MDQFFKWIKCSKRREWNRKDVERTGGIDDMNMDMDSSRTVIFRKVVDEMRIHYFFF